MAHTTTVSPFLPWLARFLIAAVATGLAGCGTPRHPLPVYEPPMAKTAFQTVRTTAYTHTESDHLAYTNHNALGGILHAAAIPAGGGVMAAQAAPARYAGTAFEGTEAEGGFHPVANVPEANPPAAPPEVPSSGVGSAAADWSRWPAGTLFRLASTGQVYKVDDYGWALAGRNTIDLYQPTRASMNAWGVRREALQILHWGDASESLRMLRNHQKYRHIRRMVLELEGHERAAANLR